MECGLFLNLENVLNSWHQKFMGLYFVVIITDQ